MTKAGIAGPKANSQAYPVDVILPSRLLSPRPPGAWLCGEAVVKPHQRSLLLRLTIQRLDLALLLRRVGIIIVKWRPKISLR
jgi:hypothetical protein